MSERRRYCGLTLDTDWPLEELPESGWDKGSDIVIRMATIPASMNAPVTRQTVLEIGHNDVLYALPDIARYRVCQGGRRIEIDPAEGADPAAVTLFLLHPVFVLACIRRGDWLLAASAVAMGGQAVAFAGITGAGKSSLAALMTRDRHPLIADGLLRLERNEDGSVLAHPQAPWAFLWPDFCADSGTGNWPEGTPARQGLELRRHVLTAIDGPIPLGRVAIVQWAGRPDGDALNGLDTGCGSAVQKIRYATAGRQWLASAGDRASHLRWAASVASVSSIDTLTLPWHWRRYDEVRETVTSWALSHGHEAAAGPMTG